MSEIKPQDMVDIRGHTLLFLKTILLTNRRLEEKSVGLIFRFDYNTWLLGAAF